MDPKKILIIDDSKLIHKMFEVMLRSHRLVHAEDGIDGIQRLAEHADVELIVLDINMPRMNGLEFLREVKKDEALSTIPVVVVSTEGKDEDTERAMELGASAYITKPFQSESILEIVSKLTVSGVSN
ncbi:MAG: response regulator [Thermoanaerobaculia bacterium]